MKRVLVTICLMMCAFLSFADAPAADIVFFQHKRSIKVSQPGITNYIVPDPALWQFASPNFSDVRIFNGSTTVPHAVRVKSGSMSSFESDVKMLNKGIVNGVTRFLLQVPVDEYDRLRLRLSARDFVAKADVAGANEAETNSWTDLGTYSLYDFSKENLGSSTVIRLQTLSRFRYLRITIHGPVEPQQVMGASVADLQEEKAKFISDPIHFSSRNERGKTELTWELNEAVPVARIDFMVDETQINFSRNVHMFCENREITSGELSRIRMERKGHKIEHENLAIYLDDRRCKNVRVEVANGDDPPLKIQNITVLTLERRIYFDPNGATSLTLYYGDNKLSAPVYDYEKFFNEPDEGTAAQASLTTDIANPDYKERPDERPWTEQHPEVMWIAMVLAILLLGAWAVKGFKSTQ